MFPDDDNSNKIPTYVKSKDTDVSVEAEVFEI
jgi:hypothetical protein